ncbi:MAG: hypothetical protein M1358_00870 [Chloroflexi bacterium]|nr:hypothetical protein [Chloroflexota bacterium]
MNPMEVIEKLAQLDIRLLLNGDKLTVDAPESALTPEVCRQITAHRVELIALLAPGPTEPDFSAPCWQDPREDLAEDSGLWRVVLTIARDVDEQLFGALHGFRCLGGKLTLKDDKLSLTGRKAEGWESAEAFKQDYHRWILPHKAAFAEVLRKARELPRSAFMAGLGYSITGIQEREHEKVA